MTRLRPHLPEGQRVTLRRTWRGGLPQAILQGRTRPCEASSGIESFQQLSGASCRGQFVMNQEAAPQKGPDSFSWIELGATLLRWRRLVFTLPLIVGGLFVAVTLALPKVYVTSLSFTPIASTGAGLSASSLAGLAGQFGVTLPMSDVSSSPEFYAYLMRSDGILRSLAEGAYRINDDGTARTGNFIDLYELQESTPGRTMYETLRVLRERTLKVSFDARTSLVSADVETKWPDLSLQMANRLLQLVDSFNIQSRQSLAGLESQFLVNRIDTAKAELRAAENALQTFLTRNRSYESDPILLFEQGRLQREVSTRQNVFSALTQSYEQSRLAAVHNTPSVSVVDQPTEALRFKRRRTLTKLLGGMALGLMLALGYMLTVDAMRRVREDDPSAMAEFDALLRATADDAKGIVGVRRTRDGATP